MTAAPRRIAILSPSLRGGGLERMVADLALAVHRAGREVGVFTLHGLGVNHPPLEAAGIQAVDCEEREGKLRGWPGRMVGALRRFAPDVVHAHSGCWYPAVVYAMVARTPAVVFTDHGRYPPEPFARALFERLLLQRTDLLTAVTPALAAYVKEFLHLDQAPLVIPNGIELARYRVDAGERERRREEWGIARDELVVMSVGRFAPVKNHALMIDAFARAARGSDARLVLLGQGPLEAELRQRARQAGLTDRVLFPGYRPDVAECLSAADVWISTSLTEAMPVALIEALAAGLPVVATAVGGVPEVLGTPPAGYLVPVNDLDATAAALSKLMTDNDLRIRLRVLARDRALPYSLDAMAEAYLAAYSVAAARRSGS